MPETKLWELYPALGIIILIMGVIGVALKIVWREFKAWMERSDVARAEERNTQRAWEAGQTKEWRDFIQSIETHHSNEEERNRQTLTEVVESVRQMAGAVKQINQTLSDHILEDAARFDVLLTPAQKTVVEDRKTQPRKPR